MERRSTIGIGETRIGFPSIGYAESQKLGLLSTDRQAPYTEGILSAHYKDLHFVGNV